jgi:DNA-binding response OmpR family regulator
VNYSILLASAGGEVDQALPRQVRRCGYTIESLDEADQVLRALCSRSVDLVIVCGAGSSAIEICRMLSVQWSGPVLAVLDTHDEDRTVALLRSGAERIIHWPCTRRELEARLSAALRMPRTPAGTQREGAIAYRPNSRAGDERGMRRAHGNAQSWDQHGHARSRGAIRKECALEAGNR